MYSRAEADIAPGAGEHVAGEHDGLGSPFAYGNEEVVSAEAWGDHDGLGAGEGPQLGCSKCRYSKGGCSRCRHPAYRPRKGSVPSDELAALAGQQQRSAQGDSAPGRPAKRRRKGRPTQAPPPSRSSSGRLDTLVSQLRRHLGQQQQPQPGLPSAAGLAERLGQLHTSSSVALGEERLASAQQGQQGQQPQQREEVMQEDLQAAPAPGSPAPSDLPGGPAGSQQPATAHRKHEVQGDRQQPPAAPRNHQVQGDRQQPPAAAPQQHKAGDAGAAQLGSRTAPGMQGPKAAASKKRHTEEGNAEQPPTKQRKAGAGQAVVAAVAVPPRNGKRSRSPGAKAAGSPPPRQFRRVLPRQVHHEMQQGGAASMGALGPAPDAATSDDMDVDGAEYVLLGVAVEAAVPAAAPPDPIPEAQPAAAGSPGGVHPGAAAGGGGEGDAAAAVDATAGPEDIGGAAQVAVAGSKRSFLSLLEANMEARRRERRESGGGAAAAVLLQGPGAAKRRKRMQQQQQQQQQGGSPATSEGTGASEGAPEPDPRLCLWEPPVSPFGLLEEELYDDPWKVLVACMLLNKTTAAQVRKVIWDLFVLCPTPTAAVSADVIAIESLITPLGLFRKRAVAIQRLSQDYLAKQWRDPQELYGIGKYAADAYQIFCRGRWREVVPDDKDLLRYQQWLDSTGGLGSGLTRHCTIPAGAAAAALAAVAAEVPTAQEVVGARGMQGAAAEAAAAGVPEAAAGPAVAAGEEDSGNGVGGA